MQKELENIKNKINFLCEDTIRYYEECDRQIENLISERKTSRFDIESAIQDQVTDNLTSQIRKDMQDAANAGIEGIVRGTLVNPSGINTPDGIFSISLKLLEYNGTITLINARNRIYSYNVTIDIIYDYVTFGSTTILGGDFNIPVDGKVEAN